LRNLNPHRIGKLARLPGRPDEDRRWMVADQCPFFAANQPLSNPPRMLSEPMINFRFVKICVNSCLNPPKKTNDSTKSCLIVVNQGPHQPNHARRSGERLLVGPFPPPSGNSVFSSFVFICVHSWLRSFPRNPNESRQIQPNRGKSNCLSPAARARKCSAHAPKKEITLRRGGW
jgi:hypothetical protein